MSPPGGVLADTCVWIEYFRTTSKISEELKALIREGRLVTTGVVLLELIHGVRSPQTKKIIEETLLALPFLESTADTWMAAGEMGYMLRRKGITLPATDLLVAAVAKINACALFTTDSHFEHIPELQIHAVP